MSVRKRTGLALGLALLAIVGPLAPRGAKAAPDPVVAAAAPPLALVAPIVPVPLPTNAPSFADSGDKDSLLLALERQREWLAQAHDAGLKIGSRAVSIERLRLTNEAFARLVEELWGTPEFDKQLRARFDLLTLQPGGATQVTGYYLPIIEAHKHKDKEFRFPLYRRPVDLMTLELGDFKSSLQGERIVGRLNKGQFVPYYSRKEIEDDNALAGRSLELAWVKDELDRFLLMVQGSGVLRFPDGQARLALFAGSNGRPYASLGKLLIAAGKIPADRVSIPAIRAYFNDHPDEVHGFLVQNPTYVFFKLADSGPYGVDGIPLTPGRSIASDKRLAPSGAIAYLRYQRPKLGFDGVPLGYEQEARFVCDQDAGSAIVGPGRTDVYWGSGEEAATVAGSLNATGSLTYLILRPEAEGSL